MFPNAFDLCWWVRPGLQAALAPAFQRVQHIICGFVTGVGHSVQFFLSRVFLYQKVSYNACCQKRGSNSYRPFIFHANNPFLIHKQKLFRAADGVVTKMRKPHRALKMFQNPFDLDQSSINKRKAMSRR